MIPCLSLNSHTFNNFLDHQVSPQIVAEAIAYVVNISRCQGKTLEDLVTEILAEDPILDQSQRRWLSNIIIQAWKNLPSAEAKNYSSDSNFKYRDTSLSTTLSTS
jgi:hypothetical protein